MELKEWLLMLSFIFSVVILSVIILIGFLVPETSQEPKLSPSVVFIEDSILDENASLLSYDNIRFVNPDITYSFSADCSSQKILEVDESFSILSDETILDFRRIFSNGDIHINCFENVIRNFQAPHLVGTGGPVSIINTSRYYVVSKGSVNLYGSEVCERPLYAIHEILHVLGFTHSTNKKSVMYEVLSCDQIITDEILNEISSLYEDPVLPDLKILDVNASKSGRYLALSAVVLNTGLASTGDTTITLYGNDRNLIDFDIGSFDIGVAKVIYLDEIKVLRKLSEFILVVDDEELIDEIDELNNIITFEV